MLSRTLIKYAKPQQNTLRYFSNGTPNMFGPNKSQVPKFDPIEFTPFKSRREKAKWYAGYTLPELYGQKYMYNHSPIVRKEMAKDDILFIVAFISLLFVGDNARRIIWEYEAAFTDYQEAKLSYNRFKKN